MGRYIELVREQDEPGYRASARRRGGIYRAFVPDKLADIAFEPDAETTAAVADATEVASRVDEYILANGTTPVLSVLSKSESIASSLIEQIGGSTHNIILALHEDEIRNDTIRSVVKNIQLTDEAIARFGDRNRPIVIDDITHLQAALVQYRLAGRVMGAEYVGIRTIQNRIGGTSVIDAEFVPPPPGYLDGFLLDLVDFINEHHHVTPIVAAAFAHAQFETLHPFADGNGRTGRAIIQGMLRRDGVVRHAVFPISTVLKGRATDYIDGLNSFRASGSADPKRVNAWVRTFAYALADAAELAKKATDDLIYLRDNWHMETQHRRADAIDDGVIDSVFRNLAVNSASIAAELGVTEQAARQSLQRLETVGILDIRTRQKRHQYYAPAIVSVIDDIETQYIAASQPELILSADEIETTDETAPRCGAPMPRSRTTCNLRSGHPGHHQHK